MAGPSLIVRVDALRQVAFGSITGSYTTLGAVFAHPMRIIKLVNNTDGDMLFSFDGTTNNDFVPAGGSALYDLTTNGIGQEFVFQIGTQVYIKSSTSPSKGNVSLMCVYGQGQ